MKYVPNAITISRIIVTPILLALLFWETLVGQGVALVLFILAAISDYFDGKLARTLGAEARASFATALAIAAIPAVMVFLSASYVDNLVIALVGGLGAGKTHFVKGIGRGDDVPDEIIINSPTFVIVRR